MPIAFLLLSSALRAIAPSLEEAAGTMGARPATVFATVTLPLLRPAIANAVLLGFVESLGDFGNPLVLGGEFEVPATRMFFAIAGARHEPGRAAALAILLLGLTLAAFWLQERWVGRRQYVTVSGKGDAGLPALLPPLLRRCAGAVAYPWAVFTGIVYLIILFGAFVRDIGRFDLTFTWRHFGEGFAIERTQFGLLFRGAAWDSLFTTLQVAAISAPITAMVGLLLAWLFARTEFRGKSTMLRLLAGLELPSAGRIEIDGRDVTALPASERRVAMVFQSYALFPHMTVAENVAYGLSVSGRRKKEALASAGEMLGALGLEGLGARLPSELSGGQQQRVAVARALVLRPRVLLFDEPLSNLDARLRRRVRGDIRDLQRQLNLTVVYVTHAQQEALAVSDTVVVMREGRIAQMGPPRALYEAPQDGFIADFMGEANVVEAEVVPGAGAEAVLRFPGGSITAPLSRPPEGRTKLAVRPEAIALAPPGGAGLAGNERRAVFVGNHMEYEVTTPAGELFLIGPADGETHRAGDPVTVCFRRAIPLG